MDSDRFDRFARAFATGATRRHVLQGAAAIAGLASTFHGTSAAAVPRGPGQVCRKSSECMAGTTCEATSTGRSVCTCATGMKACGKSCIPTASCCKNGDCPGNQVCLTGSGGSTSCGCETGTKLCGDQCIQFDGCCSDDECDTCGCIGCDSTTHACQTRCDLPNGEVCADGVCKSVCTQPPCGYVAGQCSGTGCACRARGGECLDCCCTGEDCTCGAPGSGACAGQLHHCCCGDVECDCSPELNFCCAPGDICTSGNCCEGPGGAYCFPAPIFAVPR